MKDRMTKIAALVISATAVHGEATAHHSNSMYDQTKPITLVGTVTEVRWANPHVTLLIDGKAEGTDSAAGTALWLLEQTSPANLMRMANWTRTSVKPGDRVRVKLAPLRNSERQAGFLLALVLTDTGQSFTVDFQHFLSREEPRLDEQVRSRLH
jgi:Family of unknown function (DUF6152)